jgi:hypothetical protein
VCGQWFGEQKFLWKDKWLDEEPLNVKFNRLFDLTINKNILVVEIYRRGLGMEVRHVDGTNFFLCERRSYIWSDVLLWVTFTCKLMFKIIGSLLVSGAYHLITRLVLIRMLSRIRLFLWRCLFSRRSNQVQRRIVLLDLLLCIGGCRVTKTFNHLFFYCDFSQSFWSKILNWLGVHCLLSNVVVDHVIQFCNYYVFSKDVHTCLKQIDWLSLGSLERKK